LIPLITAGTALVALTTGVVPVAAELVTTATGAVVTLPCPV